MDRNRRIKLIVTLAAAGTLLTTGVGWLADPGSEVFRAGTIGSAVALVAFAAILVSPAPPVLVVPITAVLTIVTSAVVPEDPIRVMATVGLVVLSTVGVVLVGERRTAYVGVMTTVILFHTALTGQPTDRILSVGGTSAVCFLIGAAVIETAFRDARRLHEERLDLLDLAPAFIAEDDWSEAERRVREMGISDPDELRSHLVQRPELVADLLSTVRVIHHNPALIETFGQRSDGVRFRPDRVHQYSIGAFVEQLVSIMTDRPFHDYQYRTTTKDGAEIYLSLRSIVNRRHPDQTRVLLVAQDITEQHDSKFALEQAIVAKDEFVAGVSHELRTPLAGVVGLTASVLDGATLTPDDRELLEMVADQADEMARIIDDLLVAGRARVHELVITLGPVDACVEARNVAAGRDMTVTADGSVMIYADAGRVRQVIRNLATNASRYGQPPVEIHVVPDGSQVRIEVSDDGPPIPEGLREQIFEPYQTASTTNSVSGSAGLGLAVARTLARRMGGDVSYEHDGQSRFILTLPAYADEHRPHNAEPSVD
jgi:signal transduction histidine kinase